MNNKVRLLLKIIGALSVISGIYMFIAGGQFFDYFFPIFVGVVLLGSAFINERGSNKN